MKSFSVLLPMLFFSAVSQAEIERTTITCTFTNPFLTTIYKTVDMSFTIYDAFTNENTPPTTFLNVRLVAAGDMRVNLVTREGETIQKLHLNFNGSDGVSDVVYPYSAEWKTDRTQSGKHIGGCTQESED